MVFNKGLFFALNQRREEEDGLLYDPFVVGRRRNLPDGHVYLLDGGILDTGVRQRPAAFVAEDVGKLLEPDLDRFGGVDVLGQVGRFAPDGLEEGTRSC